MIRLKTAAAACFFVLAGTPLYAAPAAPAATAATATEPVVLVPHRAYYELKLAHSSGNRAVNSVRGMILYDFSGNACDGYALKFRQVSDLNSSEGQEAFSDLNSTTWEDGTAKRFRFASENKLNQQAPEKVEGQAERNGEGTAIALTKPESKSLKLPVNVVFPTEHMRKIINAARAGKKILEVVVYDGSDTGDKLFNTLTVIGHPIAPGVNVPADVAGKAPALANLTRWPVTVSYFERNTKAEREGEETPAYSITFELYENGVSRALMLNYSDFSISGELTSLDVMKPTPCK